MTMALLVCCLVFVLWACAHVAAETREFADLAEVDRLFAIWRGTGPTTRRDDYASGRWCGECRHGHVEDPPCCWQPPEPVSTP